MEVKATGGQRAASQSLIALEPKWRAGARTATGVKNARVDKSGCSIVEIEGGRVLRAVYVALIFCLFFTPPSVCVCFMWRLCLCGASYPSLSFLFMWRLCGAYVALMWRLCGAYVHAT